MLQLCHCLGFGVEASELFRPGVGAGQDHLQSNDAVESDVAGLVDSAHSAMTESAQNFITRDVRLACGRPWFLDTLGGLDFGAVERWVISRAAVECAVDRSAAWSRQGTKIHCLFRAGQRSPDLA